MIRRLNRHHILAFVFSSILMLVALFGIFAGDWFAQEYDPKVMVRKVSQTFTPPPPPPQTVTKQMSAVQPNLQLNTKGTGPSLDLTLLRVNEPLNALSPPVPEFNHDPSQLDIDFAVDWQAFGLGELDSLPILLTQIRTKFPKSLARKGIKKAKVLLDVFIDEQGHISLIGIKEMPYQVLLEPIHKIISTSRFSVPTKNGEPVRARFIWPVEITKS